MHHNYRETFGGRSKAMSRETGGEFWLKLSRVSPPLIDPSASDDFYRCRVRDQWDRPTDYRGPASDVNDLADGDAVGADIDGNHGRGEGGNVLTKSGDVQTATAEDPIWQRAAVTTKP